jgi:hypothetical protein
MKVNEKDVRLRNCLRLLKSAEFDPLRELLADTKTQTLAVLTNATETVDIYRLQGRLKALEGFLVLVSKKDA